MRGTLKYDCRQIYIFKRRKRQFMKKTSKMFVGLALAGMLLTGCNFQGPNASLNSQAGTYEKQQIYQLYKAAGGTMTYDEWLNSVRGADGASLLADTKNPSDSDGKNGDVFVNISTWDIFLKVGGAWQPAGNIKGAQGEKGDRGEIGPQGPQGEQGPQGPAGADGKDGKDGLDGKDGKDGIDGKNGADGKDGADGASFLSGNGRPANSLGKDGDTYFDFVNKDFYQKANGIWKKVANLNGELQWAPEVAADMIKYLGETLPFADYEEETIEFGYYSGYESSYGLGLWYLWDSSENYILDDYGEKLLAAGFTQGGLYTTSTTNYIKTTASGIDIEVGFGFDEGNVINVYMPKYVPPFSAEYFLDLGFEAVDGWPADHVAQTVGADRFAGVNLDGTWYEKFGVNNGEYYYDLLATEGEFADDLGEQALAAGFLFEPDYNVYFDAKGNPDAEFDPDNDAYLTMQEKDGWTYARFFGETLPYTEEYFLDNGYTKNEGFPEELIAEAFLEENRFDGPDADWFVKSTKTEYTSGSHIGTYRITGEITTAGDVTEEMIANVLAAGFIWEDYYEDYELPNDYMTYMYITYKRGYTSIRFYGSYIPTGEVIELPSVDEVNDKIAEYYAGQNVAVAVPEYPAASATAYYEAASDGSYYKIYGSDTDEMADFAAALEAAGWQINYYSDYFEDDFKAYIGDDDVCLKVEDYYSYVKISCLFEEAPVPPVQYDVADFDQYVIDTFGSIDVAVVCAEYTSANADAYFVVDGVNAKIYGSTSDELGAFAEAMVELGWLDTVNSYGDHTLAFGASGAKLYLGDYTNSGYIAVQPSYTAPVQFDLAEFPLAELNAFLTQYDLGFTLAEAIPDAAGAGYAMESDVASGYHYFVIYVSGDQSAAIQAILEPIVLAAGYTAKSGSSGPYWANAVDHQVSANYNANNNTTEILFFE